MCHHAHTRIELSAEERKGLKKLSGLMIPIYASILLTLVAVVALGGSSRQGELVAASSAPTAMR
jgi:hypothetical protein